MRCLTVVILMSAIVSISCAPAVEVNPPKYFLPILYSVLLQPDVPDAFGIMMAGLMNGGVSFLNSAASTLTSAADGAGVAATSMMTDVGKAFVSLFTPPTSSAKKSMVHRS
jgi:hypothetical protein